MTGIPYARAHEDGSNRVTCPLCKLVLRTPIAYGIHFEKDHPQTCDVRDECSLPFEHIGFCNDELPDGRFQA